jgi:hypothetical protein
MDNIPINKKKIRSPKQIEAFNKMVLKRQDSLKLKKDQKDKAKLEKKQIKKLTKVK